MSETGVVQTFMVFLRSKALEISTTQSDDALLLRENMEQEDI